MRTKFKRKYNIIIEVIIVFVLFFILFSFIGLFTVLHPTKIKIEEKPEDYNLPYQTVTLTTDDGLALAAWFIPKPQETEKKDAIIFLHGYPANKADMLFLASHFYQDYPCLLIDFRSFGQSQGFFTTLGANETKDVKAAINYLKSQGYQNIHLFGFSLGAATALLTAEQNEDVTSVTAYAPYADIISLGEQTYHFLSILKKPLVRLMAFWAKTLLNIDLKAGSPARAAANIKIPVFLIHSRADEQIPFSHAEQLQSLLKNKNNQYYFFNDKVHGDYPSDLVQRVKEFMQSST